MTASVPSMVFGDTQVYRDGLSGRLGDLTRSVMQEFEHNEGGVWMPELDYVLGRAQLLAFLEHYIPQSSLKKVLMVVSSSCRGGGAG